MLPGARFGRAGEGVAKLSRRRRAVRPLARRFGPQLDGRRILVIEDSPIVADDTGEIIRSLGDVVVDPAPTMATALQLAGAGIPFLLTSRHANWAMPEEWEDRPRLPEPNSESALREQLKKLLAMGD